MTDPGGMVREAAGPVFADLKADYRRLAMQLRAELVAEARRVQSGPALRLVGPSPERMTDSAQEVGG